MDLAVLFDSIDEEIVVGAVGLMTDDSEDGLIGLVENFGAGDSGMVEADDVGLAGAGDFDEWVVGAETVDELVIGAEIVGAVVVGAGDFDAGVVVVEDVEAGLVGEMVEEVG